MAKKLEKTENICRVNSFNWDKEIKQFGKVLSVEWVQSEEQLFMERHLLTFFSNKPHLRGGVTSPSLTVSIYEFLTQVCPLHNGKIKPDVTTLETEMTNT